MKRSGFKALFALFLGMFLSGSASWAETVRSYDASWAMDIPENWQIHNLRRGEYVKTGLLFVAGPKNPAITDPRGMTIFAISDPGTPKSIAQRLWILTQDRRRKQGLAPDDKGVRPLVLKIGFEAYESQDAGSGPKDFTRIVMANKKTKMLVMFPNVRRQECLTILNTLNPAEQVENIVRPKMGLFSMRVPSAWSVYTDNPTELIVTNAYANAFGMRLMKTANNLVSHTTVMRDILIAGMSAQLLERKVRLVAGPSALKTAAFETGQLYYVTGNDSVGYNHLEGIFNSAADKRSYALMCSVTISTPIDVASRILNSYQLISP